MKLNSKSGATLAAPLQPFSSPARSFRNRVDVPRTPLRSSAWAPTPARARAPAKGRLEFLQGPERLQEHRYFDGFVGRAPAKAKGGAKANFLIVPN